MVYSTCFHLVLTFSLGVDFAVRLVLSRVLVILILTAFGRQLWQTRQYMTHPREMKLLRARV